jgi:hypothetical protein
MRRVHQTVFGKGGNCFAACVASLLELEIDKVPNFHEEHDPSWPAAFKTWLAQHGLFPLVINIPTDSPDDLLAHLMVNGATCIAGGQTARGSHHACIYRGCNLIHDPYPDGEGLEVIEDMTFLVPVTFKYEKHPEDSSKILVLETE